MKPTVGRMVHYRLSDRDAVEANRRRTTGEAIKRRLTTIPATWPTGAQAHIGASAIAGDVLPMIIVRVYTDGKRVNGQVLLDGNDSLWVQGVEEAGDPDVSQGRWFWPPRA